MQRVTQGSIYATIWLNMPEYVWIYDNRQGSEYASYNTQREVTLQVNEYLLRDQRSKMELFGKIIIVFNYCCKKLNLKSFRGL